MCILSLISMIHSNKEIIYTEDYNEDTQKNSVHNNNFSKTDNIEYDNEYPSVNEELELWSSIERKDSYNNELQYYSKDNVLFNNNEITIVSKKENKEDKLYTSGMVISNFAYLYGSFKFDIQTSSGKGLFPAIWLMPDDNTSYPEIDIFEMIGSEPNIFYGVIHYNNTLNEKLRSYFKTEVKELDSHTVELYWSQDKLIWYIDGNIVHRFSEYIPNDYMYIIINQAIGGNWPGDPDNNTVFPNTFVINNIKIEPLNEKRR